MLDFIAAHITDEGVLGAVIIVMAIALVNIFHDDEGDEDDLP